MADQLELALEELETAQARKALYAIEVGWVRGTVALLQLPDSGSPTLRTAKASAAGVPENSFKASLYSIQTSLS
jgi:hypothetical protein